MGAEGLFKDATTIFVHAEPNSFESENANKMICSPSSWRSVVGTGAASDDVLRGNRFVDAGVIFAREDRAIGWAVLWRFREKYAHVPALLVCDDATEEETRHASSRGVHIQGSFAFAEWLDTLLKHRLHAGHLHYVRNLYRRDGKITS